MRFLQYLTETLHDSDFDNLEKSYLDSANHYIKHGTVDDNLKNKVDTISKNIDSKYDSLPMSEIPNASKRLHDVHDSLKDKYNNAEIKPHKNMYGRMLNHVSGIMYKLSLKKSKDEKTEEPDSYHGKHSAPGKEGNAPLHDLTHNGIYPADVYSKMHQYKSGDNSDFESMSVISNAKNRPNKMVKIYRAIPDNLTAKDRANKLQKKMNWMIEKHKIPADADPKDSWDTHYQKLKTQHEHELRNEPAGEKPIKINAGDWVSISKKYAMDHGRDNLGGNFKIISKTVPAKHLHTDGNSFAEWGYNPSDN